MFKAFVDGAAALFGQTGTNAPAEGPDADERTAEDIIQAQTPAQYLGETSSELSPTSSVRAVAGSLPATPATPAFPMSSTSPTSPATPKRQQRATTPGTQAPLASLPSRQTRPMPTPGGPLIRPHLGRPGTRGSRGVRTQGRVQASTSRRPEPPTSSSNTSPAAKAAVSSRADEDENPFLRPASGFRDGFDKPSPNDLNKEHPFWRGLVQHGSKVDTRPSGTVIDDIPTPSTAAGGTTARHRSPPRPQTSRVALTAPPDGPGSDTTWAPMNTPRPAPAASRRGAAVTKRPVPRYPYPPSRRGCRRRMALIPSEAQYLKTAAARRGAGDTPTGPAQETQQTGAQVGARPSNGQHDWTSRSDVSGATSLLPDRHGSDTTDLFARPLRPFTATRDSIDHASQSPVRSPSSILRKRSAGSDEIGREPSPKRVRWAQK